MAIEDKAMRRTQTKCPKALNRLTALIAIMRGDSYNLNRGKYLCIALPVLPLAF